jgi:hypothetical protein
LIYHNEISQENNLNATARLYIQENGLVYKEYFNFNELTRKNIENLLVIARSAQMEAIEELAFPQEIIEKNGQVIGYTMPYYPGRMLLDYVNDETVSFEAKISCFSQLARVLSQLPENIYIGDLHMKNVIVDTTGKIHLIDLDGFSVQQAHLLSCPLARIIQQDSRFQRTKYQKNGTVIVSRDTDILCFFDAFLYLLLGRIYFTMYSSKCFLDYLNYLEQTSFPKALIEDIQTLFTDAPNRLTVSAFDAINPECAERYTFRAYANRMAKTQSN